MTLELLQSRGEGGEGWGWGGGGRERGGSIITFLYNQVDLQDIGYSAKNSRTVPKTVLFDSVSCVFYFWSLESASSSRVI